MTNLKFLKTTISVVAIFAALLSAGDLFAYSNECVNVDYYDYASYSNGYYVVVCYDGNGNETSVKQYENNFPENGGTLKTTALKTYDEQNRQTSFARYNGDPNDGIIPEIAAAYDYDGNGNQIVKGAVFKSNIGTYDENGNPISKSATEEERREFLASLMPDRVVTDSNGNVIARFDGANRLRYAQGADGSAYTYDKNGNLKGATKRGPFTIPEANALTKDGPVNTVTITW